MNTCDRARPFLGGGIGTDPDFRKRGLGKVVLCEGLRRMKARGMTSAMVCVAYDNAAAHKLYASVGFYVEYRIYTFDKTV
jgi:mycothiol synthase